jgi:hypothetical protein
MSERRDNLPVFHPEGAQRLGRAVPMKERQAQPGHREPLDVRDNVAGVFAPGDEARSAQPTGGEVPGILPPAG